VPLLRRDHDDNRQQQGAAPRCTLLRVLRRPCRLDGRESFDFVTTVIDNFGRPEAAIVVRSNVEKGN